MENLCLQQQSELAGKTAENGRQVFAIKRTKADGIESSTRAVTFMTIYFLDIAFSFFLFLFLLLTISYCKPGPEP